MAAALAFRSPDGLAEWEEEVGRQQTPHRGQVAFAYALEETYE